MKKLIIVAPSILVLLVVSVILTGLYFPSMWSVPYTKMKYPKDRFPAAYLDLVPREVKTSQFNLDAYPNFTYYGLGFRTPWQEKPTIEEKNSLVIFRFPNDKSVVVFDPKYLPSVDDLLAKNPTELQKIKDIYGGEALKSTYNFYEYIFESSLDQISIFASRKEVLARTSAVVFKGIIVAGAGGESGLYSFTIGEIRGFQFGDPKVRKNILIYIFDKEDKEYNILVFANQEEIDFILSSIKTTD